MNTYRITAALVGLLFIVGTGAGVMSVALTDSIFTDADYLTKIAANESRVEVGALLVLTMGLTLALVPVLVFPIFKQQHEAFALGYVVFRGALETVTYIAIAGVWLFLLTVSQEYVKTDAPDPTYFQTLGDSLLQAVKWITQITAVIFSLGALMLYYVFYQTKLIPHWLSGWGFIAAIPYLISGVLALLTIIEPLSTAETVMRVPLGLQEMIMALWLIFRGFNPPVSHAA